MPKASTALLVLMLFSSLSLWGCTHQKNGATNSKIRDLETRHSKLEEDYRVVVAANDSNRKKIANIEAQRAELAQQVEELKAIAQERDELKKSLATRTGERDNAQSQLSQFSRDLQALASRAEAAVANFGPSVAVVPVSRKSE
jgi:chromosome segregation ATPase